MKKGILLLIFFFKLSDGMNYNQEDLFKTFVAKCKDRKVNGACEVHVDLIKTNPSEVCAAIHSLPELGKGLPPESYAKSLKPLVEKQQRERPKEYNSVVDQLAHTVLRRHRSAQDLVWHLIINAVQTQTREYEARCAELEKDNKRLKDAQSEQHNEDNQVATAQVPQPSMPQALQDLYEKRIENFQARLKEMGDLHQQFEDLAKEDRLLAQEEMKQAQARIAELEKDNNHLKEYLLLGSCSACLRN
jgi:hypothetical protein